MPPPETATTQVSDAPKSAFDVDAPSPEVKPIYLRRLAEKVARLGHLEGGVPARPASPAAFPTAPAAQRRSSPDTATTNQPGFDPEVLADAICRELVDSLYPSIRAVVVAAIRSVEPTPTDQDAPSLDASVDAQAPAVGPPFTNVGEGVWARHLASRHDSGPSRPSTAP